MTSIVNFEENMKSTERPSDIVLNSINRFYDAGLTGARENDEFAKIEIQLSRLYANLVRNGKRTEEESEDFQNFMPAENYFNFEHEGLDIASKYANNSGI